MIKPLNDLIVIEPVKNEETTPNGILMLESAKEKPQIGIVVAVGKGRILENGSYLTPGVKLYDKVIYSRYAGAEISYDGVDVLLVREMDILAVLD